MESANVQVMRQLEELFNRRDLDAFGDLQIHMEEVGEDRDRVRTVLHFTGRGTGSGARLEERFGFLFSIRAGLVTKVEDLGRAERAPQARSTGL